MKVRNVCKLTWLRITWATCGVTWVTILLYFWSLGWKFCWVSCLTIFCIMASAVLNAEYLNDFTEASGCLIRRSDKIPPSSVTADGHLSSDTVVVAALNQHRGYKGPLLTGTIRLFWILWQILWFIAVITNSHKFPYILNPPLYLKSHQCWLMKDSIYDVWNQIAR